MNSFFRKLIFLLFCSSQASAQQMTIFGTVQDTVEHAPLPHTVAIAVRLSDSVLTSFARSGSDGFFKMDSVPVDTYQVILSHPRFGDQTFILLGSKDNTSFDLKKIILPPKSITLSEVTVVGYADPVFYKGDTLIYTADSFNVKQNAVVEDLLKKLPGIQVDKDGKIYSQGKAVDQVLVDGDEFFGTDPTIATKNLAAGSVDQVKVYDKKNENTAESDEKETIKVMDLKLKEDAKKGYFGKITGASDFNDYYEGEFLSNYFKGKRKVSVFALVTNTPRARFNWDDMWKYKLENDMNMVQNEDGSTYWNSNNSSQAGIPRTIKSGFYFNDQVSQKTKLNLSYSYSNSSIHSGSATASQYFLSDTSYKSAKLQDSRNSLHSHAPSLTVTQTLDSLSELEVSSKLKYNTGNNRSFDLTEFLTNSDELSRTTEVSSSSETRNYDWNNGIKLKQNFMKRDRKLTAQYNLSLSDGSSNGFLRSNDRYYNQSLPVDSVNQKKTTDTKKQTHNGSFTFTEPFSKKIKLEVSYDINLGKGEQDKRTLDFDNGDYTVENDTLTNLFENERNIHRAGVRFTYEVKKYSIALGARGRQVYYRNSNRVTGEELSNTVNNLLPNITINMKPSDSQNLRIQYTTNSSQPDLNQLQPVPDNSNPNSIVTGNPGLLPTYSHQFSLNGSTWKTLSGRSLWANVSVNFIERAFSTRVIYDSLGRTISQPVNVDGNRNVNSYLNYHKRLLGKMLTLDLRGNHSFSRSVNYINDAKNSTERSNYGIEMDLNFETDTIELGLEAGYTFNETANTIATVSNQDYYDYNIGANLNFTFPGKIKIESDASYQFNERRAEGYNLSYLVWNASLSKILLKNENLILSVNGYDLLNENINTTRNVQDNVISDVKTTIISRYFLFRILFKFNSNKGKEEDEGR